MDKSEQSLIYKNVFRNDKNKSLLNLDVTCHVRVFPINYCNSECTVVLFIFPGGFKQAKGIDIRSRLINKQKLK